MTAAHIVDPAGLLGEALAEASPDLMRHLLQSIINTLLSADAELLLAPSTAARTRAGWLNAMATAIVVWIPGSARSTWRSPSYARAPIFPSGSWNGANVPRQR